MRTTWQPLSNETKRDNSIELSRFFVFGQSNREEREDQKVSLFVYDFWTCWTDVWKCEWATSKKYNKVKAD